MLLNHEGNNLKFISREFLEFLNNLGKLYLEQTQFSVSLI